MTSIITNHRLKSPQQRSYETKTGHFLLLKQSSLTRVVRLEWIMLLHRYAHLETLTWTLWAGDVREIYSFMFLFSWVEVFDSWEVDLKLKIENGKLSSLHGCMQTIYLCLCLQPNASPGCNDFWSVSTAGVHQEISRQRPVCHCCRVNTLTSGHLQIWNRMFVWDWRCVDMMILLMILLMMVQHSTSLLDSMIIVWLHWWLFELTYCLYQHVKNISETKILNKII